MENGGNVVTILSIDGGGVRGIIPSKILEFLESELQSVDGSEARICDYFDVIAGTSTGGLIAAMLTAPNDNNRPLKTATQILDFYIKECKNVFPQQTAATRTMPLQKVSQFNILWDRLREIFKWLGLPTNVFQPKYDGIYLHDITKKLMRGKRLQETLTNVVIPAYDIYNFQPVIFSTREAKKDQSLNVLLSDACISTSAAPTVLPPYHFVNGTREFNVVDGGMAADNPTVVAIRDAIENLISKKKHERSSRVDFTQFIIVSLGTGASHQEKIEIKDPNEWGILAWFGAPSFINTPLIDTFLSATSDMVDFYTSLLLQTAGTHDNYFRIQYDSLKVSETSSDNSSHENLENLINVGMQLLETPYSAVNLETGLYEPVNVGTPTSPKTISNKELLSRLAKKLSVVRKNRQE